MGYGGRELAHAFRTVRGNTLTIAGEIPEEHYDFVAADGTRSVRRLLTHIAFLDDFARTVHGSGLSTLEGLDFPALVGRLIAEEQVVRSKPELLALLESRGAEFASWLDGLGDAFLSEPVGMPPGAQPSAKSRFEMLLGVKEHEMHHRGQLMLMLRMLGQVPHLTRQMQERMAAAARA
ncbi:MAG: DinB family protein [Acidobacteria bacterium]|nr:DinB family protein [Acidobacteriota bacterium]